MIIIVPATGGYVANHFSRADKYVVTDCSAGMGGYYAEYPVCGNQRSVADRIMAAAQQGVILTGGMDEAASAAAQKNGIMVIAGVRGGVNEAVESYCAGRLFGRPGCCG